MSSLLDANVMLALAWPNHQHHEVAHAWFVRNAERGWATCALTELAFVRLSSNPAFTVDAVPPSEAIDLLARLKEVGRHTFWKALPSVETIEQLPLLGHGQVTDAFLVVLAEEQRGRIVTFDRGLSGYASKPATVVVLPPR